MKYRLRSVPESGQPYERPPSCGLSAFIWLRIHSAERMDEKKFRGILGNGIAEATTDAPSCRSFEEIIVRLNREGNVGTGEIRVQSWNNHGESRARSLCTGLS